MSGLASANFLYFSNAFVYFSFASGKLLLSLCKLLLHLKFLPNQANKHHCLLLILDE